MPSARDAAATRRAASSVADDAHQRDHGAVGREVVRDVGGATEPELLVVELDDGHGRFWRDPGDRP